MPRDSRARAEHHRRQNVHATSTRWSRGQREPREGNLLVMQ
jgi:hypothetical protein